MLAAVGPGAVLVGVVRLERDLVDADLVADLEAERVVEDAPIDPAPGEFLVGRARGASAPSELVGAALWGARHGECARFWDRPQPTLAVGVGTVPGHHYDRERQFHPASSQAGS